MLWRQMYESCRTAIHQCVHRFDRNQSSPWGWRVKIRWKQHGNPTSFFNEEIRIVLSSDAIFRSIFHSSRHKTSHALRLSRVKTFNDYYWEYFGCTVSAVVHVRLLLFSSWVLTSYVFLVTNFAAIGVGKQAGT